VQLATFVGASAASSPPDATLDIGSSSITAMSQDSESKIATYDPVGTSANLAHQDDYSIEAVARPSDSLQVLISVTSNEAPQVYQFDIEDLCAMEPIGNGENLVYRLVSCNGDTMAWLAHPWAVDAKGISIPTHFVAQKGRLSQVLNLSSAEITYPVVADPYLGLSLISNVTYMYPGNHPEPNISVAVTPWLGTVYASGLLLPWTMDKGYNVAVQYGWPDVIGQINSKYGQYAAQYVVGHATYFDQYKCHALGAPVIFVSTVTGFDTRPTWDFEGYRSSNSNVSTWISTRCSW